MFCGYVVVMDIRSEVRSAQQISRLKTDRGWRYHYYLSMDKQWPGAICCAMLIPLRRAEAQELAIPQPLREGLFTRQKWLLSGKLNRTWKN